MTINVRVNIVSADVFGVEPTSPSKERQLELLSVEARRGGLVRPAHGAVELPPKDEADEVLRYEVPLSTAALD